MDGNTINICIATTCNKYLKFAASFLESLYSNLNPKYNYHLFFLSNEIIKEKTKEKLFYKKIKNFEVTFIYIDEKQVFGKYENLKNRLNIILYRWLLDDYIGENRVLFMDHDTIIRGDISELYFTDLGDNIIGAAKDIYFQKNELLDKYNIKEYFNAGIQLIDLKKWRDYDIKNKALEFLDYNFKNLRIHDQDTLNVILKNKWFGISPKWNGIGFDRLDYKETQYSKNEMKESQNPIIAHYAGGTHRPWQGIICLHSQWYLYFKYIFKTKFREWSDIYMFIYRIFTSNVFSRYVLKVYFHVKSRLIQHKSIFI